MEEVGAKVPKITAAALKNIFSKFNITPFSLQLEYIRGGKKSGNVKDIKEKFETMIKKVVEDLNYVSMDYALSSLPDPAVGPDSGKMMTDEQSLELIKSVLADVKSYEAILPEGDEEIPKIISKNMDALVKQVADHFELTLASRGGASKTDDEKIVLDVMQAIYRTMNGHDKTKGLNVASNLFKVYDMDDEAGAANVALGDLSRLYDMLKDDEQEGKFKEFTGKFSKNSKGSESKSPAIPRDQMKTRVER
jgi:hypothetical protein